VWKLKKIIPDRQFRLGGPPQHLKLLPLLDNLTSTLQTPKKKISHHLAADSNFYPSTKSLHKVLYMRLRAYQQGHVQLHGQSSAVCNLAKGLKLVLAQYPQDKLSQVNPMQRLLLQEDGCQYCCSLRRRKQQTLPQAGQPRSQTTPTSSARG
jgi:hypothetical protein